jgi:hypothetical protein
MLATFAAIWPEPAAASAMLRVISPVVAVCSSTAAAMVVWIAWISAEMSSVALLVTFARSLTSLATAANRSPCSPARAASMVAFNASRSVCSAIQVLTLRIWPISALASPIRMTLARWWSPWR